MPRRTAVVLAAAVPLSWLLLAQPAAFATSVSVRTDAHTASATAVRSVVLRLPARAADVAAYWRGAPAARVSLAFSADGVTFRAPVDAGRDEAGEQRHNGVTYGAIRSAAGAVAVRVTSDRVLARVSVLGMRDGARTATRHRVEATASAAVPQPGVLSRAGWGADESLRFKNGVETWPTTFYASKKLVVHHTDTPNGETDPATVQSRIRSIYYYHCVTQGWGDIGYNFLVDETGKVYEGRHSRDYAAGVSPSGDDALGRGVTGAHTSGWNSGTVGIALLGTLTNQDATPAAKSALEDVLAWEADRNGIDPQATASFTNPVSGSVITTANIGGHRDYGSTECPGGTFYSGLPAVRSDVAARIAASGGSAPPPAADTMPPTAPTGLTGAAGSRSAALSWGAAGDDVGVTAYDVWRATGSSTSYAVIATVTGTSLTNNGLKSGRSYSYFVTARDAAGNTSSRSNTVSVTAR
ncbi:MAG: N-acetylmuramoyl-L-alanine amidase [Actinobacteria bacterium]|nr:N-acetylmuramoyl-L-alanine amidase [Actinomycetota bacterium]